MGKSGSIWPVPENIAKEQENTLEESTNHKLHRSGSTESQNRTSVKWPLCGLFSGIPKTLDNLSRRICRICTFCSCLGAHDNSSSIPAERAANWNAIGAKPAHSVPASTAAPVCHQWKKRAAAQPQMQM